MKNHSKKWYDKMIGELYYKLKTPTTNYQDVLAEVRKYLEPPETAKAAMTSFLKSYSEIEWQLKRVESCQKGEKISKHEVVQGLK